MMGAYDRISQHQKEIIKRASAETQFDQHIRIVTDVLPWRSNEPEWVLVDLERETLSNYPCKVTFPKWYELVDIHV